MKKIVYCLLATMLLIGLCVGCAGGAAPEPSEPIVIKSACFLPTTHIIASFVPDIVDKVNKACDGKVVWEHLGGPEVIPGLDQFAAVKGGTLDASFLVTAYYTGEVPEAYCANLSLLDPWVERESGFYDLMNEVHEAQNTHYLGRWHRMGFYIWPNEPIDKVAQLEGLKLRGGGVCYDPWFKELGVTGVQVPPPDVYSSLERGVVKGFGWPMFGSNDYGWLEVTKNCIDNEVYSSSNALTIINLDTWNKIPKPLQDTITEVFAEAEHDMVTYFDALYQQERQKALDAGVTFVKLSADEGEWYVNTAYESAWAFQKSLSDAHYDQLRKSLSP